MKALISATFVKELKKLDPPTKPYEIHDTQMKGFLLRVQPSGVISYIAQYGRGKRITIGRVGVLKPAEARESAREKLAKASLGQDPGEERIEVCDLTTFLEKHYLPYMETHWKTGAKQVQKIRSAFPELLDKKLTEITAWMVQKRNSERLKKVKARTVKRDLEALKACLNRAVDWKVIKENPLNEKSVEKALKAKIDRSARVRYLSQDEEKRLLEALDNREERIRKERDSANTWRRERDYEELPDLRGRAFADHLKPMVILSLHTGVRRSEVFNLTWKDVDLDQGMLTIEGTGAKNSQTRHIPLNGEALSVLQAWREQSTGVDYVFPGPGGERLTHVTTSWRSLVKAAKLTDFRWHDLRHDFASKLVMAGEDLNVVRELLGHSDIKMTLRYAHLAPERKRLAVEKLSTVRGASSGGRAEEISAR